MPTGLFAPLAGGSTYNIYICITIPTGLFAPLGGGSTVPRYDSYFLRTSAFDVPAEGMSAFAQEMDDLQVCIYIVHM